ncbi:flavin-containing monooxygenase FMO GS-OX2-like isoform X2 [Rhododendron vialii]|uniref:flavin-containing monooxygenase FMO GS-OX2-like isoform X2 n=1 Tax=Rhododendron vialii TaxID=182163 RepID=UPI00265F61D5|nr:flavin-containing monooxygenase FMO GS-OX2-like isoform X2 [Rhododendron vialii]
MEISLKVAIIGAGVSGLVTARELLREGHRVVVYEKSNQPGGTWVYDPRVESDPLGLDPKREIVDSSLYSSLRTNLPRHLMGLSDYSFTDRVYGDPRNFPGHEEVLKFVKDFAREFGLTELIRFETEVVRVERFDSGDDDEWVVESRTSGASGEEEFQAVVVCTGHYAETVVANLPGIEQWPGKQLHSHNYRVPDPFQNQVVVIIGSGPSAIDISREIASVAKQVHLSSRSPNVKVSNFDNTWQHSEVIIFAAIELQSKWVARVLSGKAILPSEKEMLVDVEEHYRDTADRGVPKHHTHKVHPHEFEYLDMIADLAGVPPVAERIKEIQKHFFALVLSSGPDTKRYRDEWDPNDI